MLAPRLAELEKRAREVWKGVERQAVIEIVRSADEAAFAIRFLSQGEADARTFQTTLHGVAPALATFLPALKGSGPGLPFGPSNPATASWMNGMLLEFGKIAELQRIAALERYGLCKSERIDARTLGITLRHDTADAMDRDANHWLGAETMRRICLLQRPPPDLKHIHYLLDSTSGVQDNWMIRYEGHEELLECYGERALAEVFSCAEAEALPFDANIGGRLFAEWNAVCVAALGKVFTHIAYATRLRHRNPHLLLRNLMTIPVLRKDAEEVWLETGDEPQRVASTISHLLLDAESIKPWREHYEIPAPFYIDAGGPWMLLPIFGALLNPVCGLVRTLRLRHGREWDTAVGGRENYFRTNIQSRFRAPRFVVPDRGFVLRREDGSHLTDVDAAIMDRQTGTLALLQLKWPDIFGLSPRERESRRLNLLKANEWVDRVHSWIGGRTATEIGKALGHGLDASIREPLLFVIPRYNARFGISTGLDHRAAWVSWSEVMRLRLEEHDLSNPLQTIADRFKAGGALEALDPSAKVVYNLHELEVRLDVA